MNEHDTTASRLRSWTPPETLRELEAAGCATLIPELVNEFVSDTRARLVRMRQAVATSDAVLFRREAHSIKGSAKQMGGEEVAALAKALELEGSTMPSWSLRECISQLEGEVEELCREMTDYTVQRGVLTKQGKEEAHRRDAETPRRTRGEGGGLGRLSLRSAGLG